MRRAGEPVTVRGRLGAAAAATLALSAMVACGSSDSPGASGTAGASGNPSASTAPAAAAADSPYCRTALAWAVHELTPYDEYDPSALEAYFRNYAAFVAAARAETPAEIAAAWETKAVFEERHLPILERYGYSLSRMEEEGTAEEEAAFNDPPAPYVAAQEEILRYEALVCGAGQLAASDVVFEGPAPAAYCDATNAINEAAGEIFAGGAVPAELAAFLDSAELAQLRAAMAEAWPAELDGDAQEVDRWLTEEWAAVVARYDYDIRRLLLEGTPDERARFQWTHPDIRDAADREEAYTQQFCAED